MALAPARADHVNTRREASAAVVAARARFQHAVGRAPKWLRVAVAGAVRELALVMGSVDVSEGSALAELADLLEQAAPPPPAPAEPRWPRPDQEGDESLVDHRNRMAPRSTGGAPRG